MTTVEEQPIATTPTPVAENNLGGYVREYFARVRGGDVGALPAVAGLVVACIIFGIATDSFFSDRNFANLFQQGAQVTIIAMGLVFVLLLGEIDLSAGFTSGVCATVMAVLLTQHGWPWYWSVLAGIGVGFVVGLFLGTLVAKLGIPSFIVTLAAFLGLQGVQLVFLSGGTAITIHNSTILAIDNNSMPTWLGWTLYAACVVVYAGLRVMRAVGRRRRGLVPEPWTVTAARVLALAVIGGLATYALNSERSPNPLVISLKGVPIIVPIILILLVILTFILSRTAYGRHMYAIGGNAEAARRAGIRVDRLRISAFLFCSTLAAIAGIVAASRQSGVDSNLGGSNTLLYAVGAAVIGGTSLFGGKGRVLDAIIGGALIAVIDNGMGLIGFDTSRKYIVTGIVLLIAAGVDAVSRRRAAAAGR
jgi:D-xylose transport system permease protein